MTAHQLAKLTHFINDDREMLAAKPEHNIIFATGLNLRQVHEQLEAVCKESNAHCNLAFPPEENEDLDGPDLRGPADMTADQREHLLATKHLEQYIEALRELVGKYEVLVAQTN